MVRPGPPYFLILILILFLVSCNKDEPEAEEERTCIEGWVDHANGDGFSFEKCPQNLTECTKILKIFINVIGYWNDGPGVLTIRNIENGYSEEFRREQLIYRHRFQIKLSYNRKHNYTHEVTLELPSNSCTINGEEFIYTFAFDIPCDEYADLKFDICTA